MTTKQTYKNQTELKFQVVSWASLLFGFSGLFTGIYGLRALDNYFQEAKFTTVLVAVGIVSGLIFYYLILCPFVSGLINFKDNNWPLPLGFVIGFLGISFGLGVYLNKHNSKIKYCDSFKVERKSQNGGRYISNYIFVTIDNQSKRLICTTDFWNSISENQLINLCVINGKLGYDYIYITDEEKASP